MILVALPHIVVTSPVSAHWKILCVFQMMLIGEDDRKAVCGNRNFVITVLRSQPHPFRGSGVAASLPK